MTGDKQVPLAEVSKLREQRRKLLAEVARLEAEKQGWLVDKAIMSLEGHSTSGITIMKNVQMPSRNRTDEPEIEITPEMIEAGSDVLKRHWSTLQSPEPELFGTVPAEIFQAMLQSQR